MKNLINKLKNTDFKKVLLVWLAVGILFGGYLIIYPIKYKHTSGRDRRITYTYGKEGQLILLITVVGSIVIYGFGSMKKKTKSNRNAE